MHKLDLIGRCTILERFGFFLSVYMLNACAKEGSVLGKVSRDWN